MELDINLIGNFIVAMIIYRLVLKGIAGTILTKIINSKTASPDREDFKTKLRKKLEENESN